MCGWVEAVKGGRVLTNSQPPPPTSHSQGESRSLRKQLQEVVLRLDESREKTGDAHFMVEALRNEQDRLMRDHNAALDGAMAELEMLRRG